MKKLTLLQTAKSIKVSRKTTASTDEEIELALAWAKGDISYSQAQKAYGRQTQVYHKLAMALRTHIRKNL